MARIAATLSAPESRVLQLARTLLWAFMRVFSIVLLLAAWEILARSGTFTHFQLPALSEVIERIGSDAWTGDLWINTALTLYRALAAFLICAVFGVIIGMAMSRNAIANWFFGRLSDAEDRLPAGGDPVARGLRRVQDHHHRHRRDLSGDRRHRHRHPGCGTRTALVGAQHGGQ
jgi:ABC-type proline/glycine betaine transport system permease subunit